MIADSPSIRDKIIEFNNRHYQNISLLQFTFPFTTINISDSSDSISYIVPTHNQNHEE